MKTKQQSYPNLAKALGTNEVYLKREDEHKYGSHKGRSIPHMIKMYTKDGARDFVISSSGNAALAAVLAVQAHNQNNPTKTVTLKIFVGQKIDESKLNFLKAQITDKNISLETVERPKQAAFAMEKDSGAKNLRQSTDDLALFGYQELAEELSKIKNLAAVFMPTSSGTTAQALAEAFKKMQCPAQVHIVQTTACHPIAEVFDTNFSESESSLAGAIVDNVAHRKDMVVTSVKETGGSGWVINDEEITEAQRITKETTKISISPNSALAVAGLRKAAANGFSWKGPVVCIISGR